MPELSKRLVRKKTLPIGSKVIRKGFNVNDILTGADTIEELEIIRCQVTEILKSASFNLIQWVSNPNQADLSSIETPVQIYPHFTKTLVTYWQPKSDLFKYHLYINFRI
mgnify:CR=1 FL=1